MKRGRDYSFARIRTILMVCRSDIWQKAATLRKRQATFRVKTSRYLMLAGVQPTSQCSQKKNVEAWISSFTLSTYTFLSSINSSLISFASSNEIGKSSTSSTI